MTIELSAVEYDHTQEAYTAILSNGEWFILESKDLRSCELEAQRYVDQLNDSSGGEYSNFRAVNDWK